MLSTRMMKKKRKVIALRKMKGRKCWECGGRKVMLEQVLMRLAKTACRKNDNPANIGRRGKLVGR